MRVSLAIALCVLVLASPLARADAPEPEQAEELEQIEDHPPLDFPPKPNRLGGRNPDASHPHSRGPEGRARNTVYFELGGGSGIFSLNYERLLADYFAIRVGGGLFYMEVPRGRWVPTLASAISFPVTVSFLGLRLGPTKVIEVGGGATVMAPLDPESRDAFGGRIAVPTLIIGYRTLHGTSGESFRFAWTPFIGPTGERGLRYWCGLAMGFEF